MLSCMYHGTVSYITSFEDFKEVMEPSVYEVLNRFYEKEKYICEREIEELQAEVKEALTIVEEECAQAACFKRLAEERKEEIDAVYQKLKEYEDLEEQGRLIKLPCKEAYTESGDIVYLIYDDEVVECTHCGLSINPVDGKAYIMLAADEDIFPYRRPVPEYDLDPTDWCTNTIDAEVGEIGKTVFLTKSEAEAKLKELRGEENER